MKKLIASVLFAGLCVGRLLADSPKAQSKDPALIDAVKQVELDMGKAKVAGDIDKLSQIYADDFATIGPSGEISTPSCFLHNQIYVTLKKLSLLRSFWRLNGFQDLQRSAETHGGPLRESNKAKQVKGVYCWFSLGMAPAANKLERSFACTASPKKRGFVTWKISCMVRRSEECVRRTSLA